MRLTATVAIRDDEGEISTGVLGIGSDADADQLPGKRVAVRLHDENGIPIDAEGVVIAVLFVEVA